MARFGVFLQLIALFLFSIKSASTFECKINQDNLGQNSLFDYIIHNDKDYSSSETEFPIALYHLKDNSDQTCNFHVFNTANMKDLNPYISKALNWVKIDDLQFLILENVKISHVEIEGVNQTDIRIEFFNKDIPKVTVISSLNSIIVNNYYHVSIHSDSAKGTRTSDLLFIDKKGTIDFDLNSNGVMVNLNIDSQIHVNSTYDELPNKIDFLEVKFYSIDTSQFGILRAIVLSLFHCLFFVILIVSGANKGSSYKYHHQENLLWRNGYRMILTLLINLGFKVNYDAFRFYKAGIYNLVFKAIIPMFPLVIGSIFGYIMALTSIHLVINSYPGHITDSLAIILNVFYWIYLVISEFLLWSGFAKSNIICYLLSRLNFDTLMSNIVYRKEIFTLCCLSYVIMIPLNSISKTREFGEYLFLMFIVNLYLTLYVYCEFGPSYQVTQYDSTWLWSMLKYNLCAGIVLGLQYAYGSRFFCPNRWRQTTFIQYTYSIHNYAASADQCGSIGLNKFKYASLMYLKPFRSKILKKLKKNEFYMLPGGHLFHEECLDYYISNVNQYTCPSGYTYLSVDQFTD